MPTPRVLIPLAAGFEEIEAVTIADVLRRAGIDVVLAAVDGSRTVTGSHGIAVAADGSLADAQAESFDMVVLPGGMPGASTLRDDARVQDLLRRMRDAGKWIGAICAAPMALGPAGIAAGKSVTSYPGFGDKFAHGPYLEDRVVVDGRLVTSRGPGTAMEFALTLAEKLCGAAAARKVGDAMLTAAARSS